MRSRAVREGSVGLLILIGLGLFGGLVLWLRGVSLGSRGYKMIIEFPNVQGIQEGTPVRYRGVSVGRITQIHPRPNGVEVTVEVQSADVVIPRDVLIEANRSGLIGESAIDITPRSLLPQSAIAASPVSSDCPNTIICNNSRLQGQVGVSIDELVRSSIRFANLYSDPALMNNLKAIAENTATAAQGAAQLTRDLSGLTQTAKVELGSLSQSVKGELRSLNQSLQGQLGTVTSEIQRTTESAEIATKSVSAAAIASANSVRQTANQFNLTAQQINELLATNRTTLVGTLNNLSLASQDLRGTVTGLTPVLNRVQQGELLKNLEVLSANAAQASANLRDLSNAVNNPTTLLMLQQTLDSARSTFQNVEKITSDLDELTGDPAFRNNIRNLVNGLGGLLGSTQQLQEQTQLAQMLIPLSEQLAADSAADSLAPTSLSRLKPAQKLPLVPPEVANPATVKPKETISDATIP